MGSKPGKLNLQDLTSVGKGALVAVGGAILTALASISVPALDLNANTQTLITVVILSVIVNITRKLAVDNR